jgi:hypothetical protein
VKRTPRDVFIKGQTFDATDENGDFTVTVRSVNKSKGTAIMESRSRGTWLGNGRRRRLYPMSYTLNLDRIERAGRGKWSAHGTTYKVSSLLSRPDPVVEFELVESDLAYGGRLYRVLRHGQEIGWVESYESSNDSPIAGTRLRRVGAQVTRWHVARTRRGLFERGGRIGYEHESRREAVRRLVEAIDR